MRRRAVSRPVGSYHSWRVWMPPPRPPPPIAIAGLRERGGCWRRWSRGGVRCGGRGDGRRRAGVEERGVVGRAAAGTISDGFDVEFWWWGCGFLCGGSDDLVEDLVDCGGGGDELDGVGGTDVEEARWRTRGWS